MPVSPLKRLTGEVALAPLIAVAVTAVAVYEIFHPEPEPAPEPTPDPADIAAGLREFADRLDARDPRALDRITPGQEWAPSWAEWMGFSNRDAS